MSNAMLSSNCSFVSTIHDSVIPPFHHRHSDHTLSASLSTPVGRISPHHNRLKSSRSTPDLGMLRQRGSTTSLDRTLEAPPSLLLSTPQRKSIRSPRRVCEDSSTPPPLPPTLRRGSFHRRVRPVWANRSLCGRIVSISIMDKSPLERLEHVNGRKEVTSPPLAAAMHNMMS